MATDPVQMISVEEFDAGFSTNLGAALREIAHYEPSPDLPYLSVYLDWRPEGERPYRRAAVTVFENETRDLLDQYDPESDAAENLKTDIQRVRSFLEEDLDPSVHGVMIIANAAHGIFDSFVLAMPVENAVAAGPFPNLLPMTRIVEDYPRYAVLAADQLEANLMIISRANRIQQLSMEGSDYPPKQKQGGFSARRYQTRAEERKQHFARAVAAETRKALSEANVEMLVVLASEVMRSYLDEELHDDVKAKIIGWLPQHRDGSRAAIIEQTTSTVTQAEREREFEAVTTLLNEQRSGGRGVIGIEETLKALQRGQVMKLVMSHGFSAPGWVDYRLNVHGVGPKPDAHPAGGDLDDIYEIDLAEEMVRLTIITDAIGEIVHDDGAADLKLGDAGVGAILRFTDQSTSNGST